MVGNELSKYRSRLYSQEKEQIPPKAKPDLERSDSVVLFFSFDIVNSSAYKTVNYYGWSIVLHEIIKRLRDTVKEKIARAEVWRVLGDEIIFIVTIFEKETIFEYTDYIYSILVDFCNKIDGEGFFEQITQLEPRDIDTMKLQNVVSVQATAWLAPVADRKKNAEAKEGLYAENIFEIFEESKKNHFYEFIGHDIDAGFRLTKQTRERRLTVSFELAYMLSGRNEYNERMQIITYRSLKGVWGGKVYPIIWYYDKSKNENIEFIDSLPFDAIEQDDIYKELFGDKPFRESMYQDNKKALGKILYDRKLGYKIKMIESLIDSENGKMESLLNESRLELHCVAVCFDKKGRALIAKRDHRKILNGKWECGCAKANARKELVDSIKDEYKNDFGITVSPILAKNRKDRQPQPIALYKVEDHMELHKGIIVLAEIESGSICLNKRKHSEYKMITEKEMDFLREEECVSDLKNTLTLAFNQYRKWKEDDSR